MGALRTSLLAAILLVAATGVLPIPQMPVAQAIVSDQTSVTTQSQDVLLSGAGGPGLFTWPDRWTLSNLSAGQQQAIAQRNDFILRDAVSTSANATMKAANPSIGFIGYVNAIWLWNGDEDFMWSYNWVNANHPEWFMKDANGRRIQSQSHWGWMMDIGNPGWQQYLTDAAMRAINNGINGIYVDDAHEVYPNFYNATGYPINPRTGAPYTNTDWKNDTYNLLNKAHTAVRNAYPNDYRKLLLYNGYIHGWQGEYFMPVADGAQSEGFIHAYWEGSGSFRDAGTWKGEIDALINFQNQGKLVFATGGSADGDLNMYTYSSYLLGKGPRSYYNYANYGADGINGWAGFNAPIGTPTGSYYYASNVYQRDYSNAKVLVNPTGGSVTVSLGSNMYQLNQNGSVSGSATNSVTLGPHGGAILIGNPSNTSPVPAAPPTAVPTATPVPNTPTPTKAPTYTPIPPTSTPVPPTSTRVPPTSTPVPTNTPVPPPSTPAPTDTPVPPTSTPTEMPVPAEPVPAPSDTPISAEATVMSTDGQEQAGPAATDELIEDELTGIDNTEPHSALITETSSISTTPSDLALGQPAFASSTGGDENGPDRLVDGNDDDYWVSQPGNYQWVYVDLGADYNIKSVVVEWGPSYARDYAVQISDNPDEWAPDSMVFFGRRWNGGRDIINDLNAYGRYVRVYCLTRALGHFNDGFTISEIQVRGDQM